MKHIAYILAFTALLLCTQAYSQAYTSTPMHSTSYMLSPTYQHSSRAYGTYHTATPKITYSRQIMRTGSRLITTRLDSLSKTSRFYTYGNDTRGFTNMTVKPILQTDGSVRSPRQFSTMAYSGTTTTADNGEERGEEGEWGSGAGTPDNITPIGNGTAVLVALVAIYGIWLRRRKHATASQQQGL